MSYAITLTSNSDIGNTTNFSNLLDGTMIVNKNSYIQVNSIYIKKASGATDPEGIFLTIPEFNSANTYWCNSKHNSVKNGMICNCLSFESSDTIQNAISSPKIPLNNSLYQLDNINVTLRDKDNKIIDNSIIEKVAISIFVSDDLRLFG
tara:strand:+ start:714 stop:1160 length:447 start_codon:yes stop_codon:yes gene_type:complete